MTTPFSPFFLHHTVLADVQGVAIVWVTSQCCKIVRNLLNFDEKEEEIFNGQGGCSVLEK